MVKPIVKLDHKEIAKQLLNAPEMQALLQDIAEDVASANPDYSVDDYTQRTRFGTDREVKRVVDNSDGAFYKEANTGRMARALSTAKRS